MLFKKSYLLKIFLPLIICLCALPCPSHANLSEGLVGWWKLNDNAASTTVIDSSGKGNSGTASNNTSTMSVTGRREGALSFNGSSQGVNLGTPSSLPTGDNPFSLSAWIYPTALQDGIIIGTLAGATEIYHLRYNRGGDNKLDFRFIRTGGASYFTQSTTLANNVLNQWTLVTGVADGSNLNIYVNGAFESQAAYLTPVLGTGTFGIGKDFANNGTYFSGYIDDVRIYNRALSSREVSDLYNDGARLRGAVIRGGKINN